MAIAILPVAACRGRFAVNPARWPALRRHISTAAAVGRNDDLLRGVAADHRDDVARVLEQALRARDSWVTAHTCFYPPPIVADALSVIGRLADVAAVPWGGYSQAERVRIALGREEDLVAAAVDPGAHLDSVAAMKVSGNFLFDPATHRDFLGACLGTGIDRSCVGDVLVQKDTGAMILVVPSMVEHLEASLTQVRSVPVRATALQLSQLRVPAPKVVEMKSVEASLRLDAIGSAGFRISRSKMADMVKGGDVRVNWQSGSKPSVAVAAGDVISCSGKGRVEIKSVSETKKGKFVVEMMRYV